jgi:hypothetical protein
VLACRDGQSFYSLPLAWDLNGPLDRDALVRAIGDLMRRHDALRTAFQPRDDEVDQLVWPAVEVDLAMVDLTGQPLNTVDARIVAEAERPRAVHTAPLWHGLLMRLGPQRHVLALFVHHLIFDGWSHGVLHDELVRCYRGAASGRPPKLPGLAFQIGDYARWERGRRDAGVEDWWRQNLASLPPLSSLPPVGGRFISTPLPDIPRGATERMRTLAGEHGAGLNTALLAVTLAARRAITGDDAIVGVTRAGRERPELQRIVGPLLDHVPVRVDMSAARTFPELLVRVHRAYQEAMSRPLPLGRIRQVVPDDLTSRGGRLFDTRYNYLPGGSARTAVVSTSDGAELRISPYAVDPMRLAPRHTEDHPEVLPLSYVLRRDPNGEMAGEVCGHDLLHPADRLSVVAEEFTDTLLSVLGARTTG